MGAGVVEQGVILVRERGSYWGVGKMGSRQLDGGGGRWGKQGGRWGK